LVDQKPPGDPDRDIVDGEHAGFSPQSLQNATPYIDQAAWKKYQRMPRIILMGLLIVILVALSQFVDEMLEIGRHPRIRTQRLLKTFAHSGADRSAGPVIEHFSVVGVCIFHDWFPP
jgi:hypothetical protein